VNAQLLAVVTYALLVVVWTIILVLYARHARSAAKDGIIAVLVVVLTLDALKNVVENVYFGLVWATNYGALPDAVRVINTPLAVSLVKLVNLATAVIILALLVRRWVPAELDRRHAQRDEETKLRAELESNLRAANDANERLRLVVKASSNFIWDANLETGEITASNDVRDWLGYRDQPWPPEPWHRIVHREDRRRVADAVIATIKGQTEVYDLKHRVVHFDGRVSHVWSTGVTTRNAANRAVRFVGAVRDISAQVAADEQRLHAQKLEGLGLLAGGIAHDFNNLLSVIGTSVDGARDLQGPALRESLSTIKLAVVRASALTRQLLVYAGHGAQTLKPVDLNELVAGMGELLTVTVPRKVKLDLGFGAELPVVTADEGQLQQVVMNLITNASDAIAAVSPERDGVVSVRTDRVTSPDGALQVRLTVTDNGIGMSAETQARIFDPFFTTKGAGRGLGLAALAGIIRSLQGSISVDSTPGVGTTFTVLLPGQPAPPRKVRATEPAATPAVNARVLLVDDEELLRRSASRLLRLLACTVDEAANGREAVEKVKANPSAYDAVLMDLTMPVMDGAEAGLEIRALAPTLPVIISSGYSSQPLPIGPRFHSLGKPYTLEALISVFGEALAKAPASAQTS